MGLRPSPQGCSQGPSGSEHKLLICAPGWRTADSPSAERTREGLINGAAVGDAFHAPGLRPPPAWPRPSQGPDLPSLPPANSPLRPGRRGLSTASELQAPLTFNFRELTSSFSSSFCDVATAPNQQPAQPGKYLQSRLLDAASEQLARLGPGEVREPQPLPQTHFPGHRTPHCPPAGLGPEPRGSAQGTGAGGP